MTRRYCQKELTGKHCTRDAVVFITYFQDGACGKRACWQHLRVLMRQVAADSHIPGGEKLRVTPLGSFVEEIEKDHAKWVRECESYSWSR